MRPGFVLEHAVAEQPLQHALDLGLGVARFDRDQRQHAARDRGDALAVDHDAGLVHALDQGDHGTRA
jgi:hypothetical protein